MRSLEIRFQNINLSLQQSLYKLTTSYIIIKHFLCSDCWAKSSVPPLCYTLCAVTVVGQVILHLFLLLFIGILNAYDELWH